MKEQYDITVQGHLAAGWARWFDGFVIHNAADGTSVLTGHIEDQSALHGILIKIRDLGLPLIAVQRVESHPGDQAGD